MALLPYLDPKNASPEVQKLLTARPVVLNVQRMTANAQKIFIQRSRLSNALFTQTTIDPRLRELAILRTAKDCHSVYEWTQHVPAARHVGLTDLQINAIENWHDASCFSELERLVLKFTDDLSPGEIIELLIIVGHWRQTASILETTEVELEEFAGKVDILANMPPRNSPDSAR
jgi:alkylhydroperoxidase/carboxymuconolactone decarboxylase family protein YurZ